MKDSARFSFVDALRGLAAVNVAFFHANAGGHLTGLVALMPSWLVAVLFHGDLGVPVFFVLSGFVIANSLRNSAMTPAYFCGFIFRRFIRLIPPYWVAIAIGIAFSVLAGAIVSDRPQANFTATQIAAHLFYAQDIFGLENINAAFWTLCLEVQFYVVFALILLLPRWIMFFGFIISLIWPLGICPPSHHALFFSLWYGFLLGVLACWAWKEAKFIPAFLAYTSVLAVSAMTRSDTFALTCVITASALLLVALNDKITVWNQPLLQFLGAISYSLYLVHNPITGATFRVGFMLTGRSVEAEALWWLVSIVGCLLTASTLWYLIERPCTALVRRFKIRSDTLLALKQHDVRAPSRDFAAPTGAVPLYDKVTLCQPAEAIQHRKGPSAETTKIIVISDSEAISA